MEELKGKPENKSQITPFNSYSGYLKRKYRTRAYRVSVDAGFSCPHRGSDRRNPGCTFCDEYGSRAVYQEEVHKTGDRFVSLKNQIERGIGFLKKRYGAEVFLLYFQAFSNTFAPIEELKQIYDYCLNQYSFAELIVSTRPDCISAEVADLLASYMKRGIDVWTELGLQSSRDETLLRINRAHTVRQFKEAFQLLRQRGIKITVHVIFGLPGENKREIMGTINYLAGLEPEGIKIHNIHIPRNTMLYEEYMAGELTVPSSARHLEYVVDALELLPPKTVIMRLTCDTPSERLGIPAVFWNKSLFYKKVRETMLKRNKWQGRLAKFKQEEKDDR